MLGNPWNCIPIEECGEPLVDLPPTVLRVDEPPYLSAGASYGPGESPFLIRAGVADRLAVAASFLEVFKPGYRFIVYDAYRPLEVQRQMVELTLAEKARERGLDPEALSDEDHALLMKETLKYWSLPSEDEKKPPLHSTGGAVDLTILDDKGRELDMGTAFDHMGPESATGFFDQKSGVRAARAHANRSLLLRTMSMAGFVNYAEEWWHFGHGDQNSALVLRATGKDPSAKAIYGRADLLPRSLTNSVRKKRALALIS